MGLDEAGRGSLIGPLVVGAYAIPGYDARASRDLAEIGVRDSKLLSPAARENVYRSLRRGGTMAVAHAEPRKIDRYVSKGLLNMLEIEMMAKLVTDLGAAVVHVDACDPDAERFGRRLEREVHQRGFQAKVHAQHKADRDIPLVGAASIVAKVTRDRAIRRIGARSGLPVGSGYPSDGKTRECVKRLMEGGKIPPWIRRSWKTFDTLNRGVGVRTLEAYA